MKLDLRDALGASAVYLSFQNVIRRPDTMTRMVRDLFKIRAGEKILDAGCGPAALLEYMPDVAYCGIDISPAYIAAARAKYGNRGRFIVDAVTEHTSLQKYGEFDLAMAVGLLHHIDDAQASSLFAAAKQVLRPGGRVVTFDNVFVPNQSLAARTLIRLDRGQHVRTKEEYTAIAAKHFQRVDVTVLHDLLRVPYTHIVLECR